MPSVPLEQKFSTVFITRVRNLLSEPESHAWRELARCRGEDVNLFFAERGDSAKARAAKAICRKCPVVTECVVDAIRTGERHGIRGGYGEVSRGWITQLAGHRRPKPLKPCGTSAAYARHLANGETPCSDCVRANWLVRADTRFPQNCILCDRSYRSRSAEQGYCSSACRMKHRSQQRKGAA